MAALRAAAGDPDPDVRLAAIEGLANFPEFFADKQIADAARAASPRKSPASKRPAFAWPRLFVLLAKSRLPRPSISRF